MANIYQDSERRLRCLSLPVALSEPLIVPNAAVAEILPYSEPERMRDPPKWLLGLYHWRGHSMPLITLQPLLERQKVPSPRQHRRIAVMNQLCADSRRPFYGIALDEVPHQLTIGSTTLSARGEVLQNQPLLQRVSYLGIPYAIPNLEYYEALANKLTL
ncbi:chemotaxis protein CheW [Ectothiorhodospiraceae bacterium BW-2]|nr:chemotaxis protein CheW [Ectothiorhodospiraceae bacterium BW-2]